MEHATTVRLSDKEWAAVKFIAEELQPKVGVRLDEVDTSVVIRFSLRMTATRLHQRVHPHFVKNCKVCSAFN